MWQVGRGGGGFHGGRGGGGFRHGGGWNRGGGRWRRPWNWGGYPFYYPQVYQPYYPTTYYYPPTEDDPGMTDLASVGERITSVFGGEIVNDKLKEKLHTLYPGLSFLVTEKPIPGSTPYTILLLVDSEKKLVVAKAG